MNRTLNQGRHDANPKLEKKEKELDLISTERVSFSKWAKFMAFKSETIEIEDSDFLIVVSTPLFSIKKTYRKMPIMVYRNVRDNLDAFLPAQPTLEFMRTGDDAGYEETFNYVVTTEGHVGYLIPYAPEWDEKKGPDIIGNNPMKASCVDELELNDRDFILQAGRRLRAGDYCYSENPGLLEKAQILLGKVKGGRKVNIAEALIAKCGRLCIEPISFQVGSTGLKNGVQTICTTDGRTGYNIINKNDVGFLF